MNQEINKSYFAIIKNLHCKIFYIYLQLSVNKILIMDYSKELKKLIDMGKYNFSSMSEYLGISRPTLYKRMVDNSWKKGEKELIKRLM